MIRRRTFQWLKKIRALVWDENPPHAPKELYPDGIRGAIAAGLHEIAGDLIEAKTANLDDPEQGITEEALANTDVLFWWGHARHGEVTEDTARRVFEAVHERGLGLIILHSGHYSKILQWTLAAPGHLKGGWRVAEPPDTEEITVCAPKHPIAEGVEAFTLDKEEMYGAPFDVPAPQVLVFQSYFPLGGEYFPSGICFTVGRGKTEGFASGPGKGVGEGEGVGRVFYFRPGHETFGTYFHESVKLILKNATLWCARRV